MRKARIFFGFTWHERTTTFWFFILLVLFLVRVFNFWLIGLNLIGFLVLLNFEMWAFFDVLWFITLMTLGRRNLKFFLIKWAGSYF
jgi:hypothetical protein